MHSCFDLDHIRELGFRGLVPLTRALDGVQLPRRSGVYVVLLDPPEARFLVRSVGGHFKGKDPTVPVSLLKQKFVADTSTMYIGRASDIGARIKLLARYGRGEPVAHQGGRYLWQLANHQRLNVAWRHETDPVAAEAALLEEFETCFGVLPFANLVRGARPVAFA